MAKKILPIFSHHSYGNYGSIDRVDDPLHINRERIGISQVFMEILRFGSRSKFWYKQGNVLDMLITVNFPAKTTILVDIYQGINP